MSEYQFTASDMCESWALCQHLMNHEAELKAYEGTNIYQDTDGVLMALHAYCKRLVVEAESLGIITPGSWDIHCGWGERTGVVTVSPVFLAPALHLTNIVLNVGVMGDDDE